MGFVKLATPWAGAAKKVVARGYYPVACDLALFWTGIWTAWAPPAPARAARNAAVESVVGVSRAIKAKAPLKTERETRDGRPRRP